MDLHDEERYGGLDSDESARPRRLEEPANERIPLFRAERCACSVVTVSAAWQKTTASLLAMTAQPPSKQPQASAAATLLTILPPTS